MDKLKVGDKVYKIETSRFYRNKNYILDEVVRLTKTQAVLKSGCKLTNEPTTNWSKEDICYSEYGDRYKKWYIQTEEIVKEAKAEKERQIIERWFQEKKFTDEEKRAIYLNHKQKQIIEKKATKP